MHTPTRSVRALLAAFAALGAFVSFSTAQSVATAPVGAVTTNVAASSDQRVGVTLLRPALYAGVLENASGSALSQASGSIPSLGASPVFVRFTSGAAEGQWVQVSSSSSASLTLSDTLESFGVSVGDKFEVRPFWTLATLFPAGAGVPVSPDPFSPRGFVLLNDSQALGVNLSAANVYFYHDGSQAPAGWYNNNGSFDVSDDVVVSPDASIILRNVTAVSSSVVNVGDVPATKVATTVVSRIAGGQDNQVFNPYPANLVLSTSELVSTGAVRPSPDPFNPIDLVLVYSSNNTGLNASASAVYFYHDGSQAPAGWYNNNGSFDSGDSVVIPPGGALTIRKAAGVATASEWAPNLPYTL